MKKLPDLDNLGLVSEKESLDISKDLNNTEEILKRLLINIEAFKKIEFDNLRLRDSLLKNQSDLKSGFKKKLDAMSFAMKEKDMLTDKVKQNILSEYKSYSEKLTKAVLDERAKYNFAKKKYAELYLIAKKLAEDNKKIKLVLLTKEDVLKRLNTEKEHFAKSAREKDAALGFNFRKLVKSHELTKMKLGQKLIIEQKKNIFLKNKYLSVTEALAKIDSDYRNLQKINEKLIKKLSYLEKESLANQDILKAKTESLKRLFTEKLKEIAKLQLNKEIDYKTRIESLNKDLAKYYDELKESKLKYYVREKKLKEKLKEILS